MSSAYEAEKRSFSKEVIQKAFRNTGIYPFNASLILKNAKENCDVIESNDKIAEECVLAATTFIQNSMKENQRTKKRVISVRAKVGKNEVHSPLQLLEQEKKRKGEEEELEI